MPLNDKKIEFAQPGLTPDGRVTAKPYKMGDSNGLFLLVFPNGSKCWRMKYRFDGQEKSLAFGMHPKVGLIEARNRAAAAKHLLDRGIDPSVVRREEKATERSDRLMRKDSSTVQVAVAMDGTVKIWKGRAVIGLLPGEVRAVTDLLMKLTG